jgi:hypothetical protein
MVAASQWNIKDLAEAKITDQTIWGIRLGGKHSIYTI